MNDKYIKIDIDKLENIDTRRDFMFILYNEFSLDSKYGSNESELKVFIYDNEDEGKLKTALEKYGADEKYVKSVFEPKNENKLISYDMKKRYSTINEEDTLNASYIDMEFVDALTSALETWDEEDLLDPDFMFNDGEGLTILRNETNDILRENDEDIVEDNEMFIRLISKNIEGFDDYVRYDLEKLIEFSNNTEVEFEDRDEEETENQPEIDDAENDEENLYVEDDIKEGFVYAKIEDIINEAKEEGRKEAMQNANSLNEAKATPEEIKEKEKMKIKKNDLRTAKANFNEKAKELRSMVTLKGLASMLKYGESFNVEELKEAVSNWYKGEGKEKKEERKNAMAIIRELAKLNNTIIVLTDAIEGEKKETTNESVTARFAKNRKLWESAVDEKEEEEEDKEEEDKKDSEEKPEEKEPEEEEGEDKEKDEKEDDKEEENEEIDIPAILLTVKKDAVEQCKKDMIDAGVAEDDIEIIDAEDEDADTVDIKVGTDSIMELKKYLEDKGIDLEEKIGVEIQEPEEEEGEEKEDENNDKKDDEEEKEDDEDFSDGLDDDFFANLGNIGDEE